MLKNFYNIWKNATVNKYQIISRRSTTSTVVHVNHFDSLTQSAKHYQNQPILSAFSSYENRHQLRCISKTVNNSNRSKNVSHKYKAMEANLKWRDDPVITILDTPQFKSILRKNILDLVALFQKYNYEIRIAGGAVRCTIAIIIIDVIVFTFTDI